MKRKKKKPTKALSFQHHIFLALTPSFFSKTLPSQLLQTHRGRLRVCKNNLVRRRICLLLFATYN